VLRGGPFDIFGYTAERKTERRLVDEYEASMHTLIARIDLQNHATAVEIANIPLQIRGFGHVKESNLEMADERRRQLWSRFENPPIDVAPGKSESRPVPTRAT
jgi:indolepyruvate ferredoxin oxidoreductase